MFARLVGALFAAGVVAGLALLALGILGASRRPLSGLRIADLVERQRSKLAAKKARRDFAAGLPRFLRSLSGAISAGGDLTGSIELVAETEASVVGKEVAEALAQYRMGQPLAKCLHALADRMQNRDLKLLAMALEMQQQTGGSLAKIIGAVLESIDGRVAVEREIRVLTAEGRLSAKILVALPALIALALAILMPDYLAFFVTDPVGLLMLAVALGLLVTGWLWMRRLVRADG